MAALFGIFLNVIVPVFSLVVLGYTVSPRLKLDSRTLSRAAYYLFVPAFVFDVMSRTKVSAALAAGLSAYGIVTALLAAGLAYLVARLLRRDAKTTAAFVLIGVFGNTGNFGLPMVRFRFPDQPLAVEYSTIFFLAILIVSFVVGVAVANFHKGGVGRAMLAVVKTPALLALPPALLVNALDVTLPPFLTRGVELLAQAMIPVMLVALGAQLAAAGRPRFSADLIWASGARLVGAPLIALALAAPFGFSGLERAVGVIQAAMPTAVLASIIAVENDLLPDFVISAVLTSTLLSLLTLTVVLAVV